MTQADIERIKEGFVATARRADQAGYDMIELHGAHGYLINQFLEPQTNHRSDSYGGTLENRFRFLKEIIESIKAIFSKPIWVRLSVTAYDETGVQNTLEDYQQIGR